MHFLHYAPHTSRKYLLETMGSGVALFDCDNDGRLDLFLVNGAPYTDPTPKGFIPQKTGPQDWNRMYHQKADGTFEDITEKSGLKGMGYGMGVAVADYDNDGYEDVFVTGYGGNHLYHNNGDCTFTDVTEKAGVAGSGWSTSAAWVDLDNDGLLDLVVARYVTWDWNDVWCGEHREGYRGICHPDVFPPDHHAGVSQRRQRPFHRGGAQAGARQAGQGAGNCHCGLRSRRAHGPLRRQRFHAGVPLSSKAGWNLRGSRAGVGGRGKLRGPDLRRHGRRLCRLRQRRLARPCGDRSGQPDVMRSTTTIATEPSTMPPLPTGVGNVSRLHSGWSLRFIDYDNDGWKDLLIAQGHDMDNIQLVSPMLRYREPMALLRNTGKKFVDVSSISGDIFHDAWVGRGMAIGDIDNDGRIDAVVSTNGGPAHILLNKTVTSNHWITLHLTGHKSNRDGIGAVVKLTTPQGSQWVTATTASGYLSSSDPRVHFGLGTSPVATSIEIRWPSGIVQTLTDVKGDRQIQVDEPAASNASTPPR